MGSSLLFASVLYLNMSLSTSAQNIWLPANTTNVRTITTPANVTIRYKEPGDDAICETTPGVRSYSGYIDLEEQHAFFWLFESRSAPASKPITLWLNGGPGSDSLLGLFQEVGPCSINKELVSILNPYSWSNVTNLLFISQPTSVGFSYETESLGSHDAFTGGFVEGTGYDNVGRFPSLNKKVEIDTTDRAAIATWHVLQGLLSGLEMMSPTLAHRSNLEFNLWTESYGGHYGPAFFRHFFEQNERVKSGLRSGLPLRFNTLGIGNGFIDAAMQAWSYPEFAISNSYGLKAINDTTYDYARFALHMSNGCLDQIEACQGAASGIKGGFRDGRITEEASLNPSVAALCAKATTMCIDNVVSP